MTRPVGLPFKLNRIGHIALYVQDLEKSARFYTGVLGFQISDVYAGNELPGGAVFIRLNADHHGIALFQATKDYRPGAGLHHVAFEVSTLDEVLRVREHLRQHNVRIHFEGRRRAGVQLAVEFQDPDGHNLEIYWGIDQIGSDGYVRAPEQWKGAASLEAAVADPVIGQDTTVQDKSLLRPRTDYDALASELDALLSGESDSTAIAANAAAAIYNALPTLNWAGFYFVQGDELVLGPFQGRPACVRIALGRGVCGTAAVERRSLLVPDVSAFPGHIACDPVSRSELVVPLLAGEKLLGVLDLDSARLARFDEGDQAGCEHLAAVVVRHLAASVLS